MIYSAFVERFTAPTAQVDIGALWPIASRTLKLAPPPSCALVSSE